jgi:hypothetical protein
LIQKRLVKFVARGVATIEQQEDTAVWLAHAMKAVALASSGR